jgi:hypothetical protein
MHLTKYNQGDVIREDEMDGTCGMHGIKEVYTKFGCKYLIERDHVEILSVGGMIVLKWILNSVGGFRVDSSGLALASRIKGVN